MSESGFDQEAFRSEVARFLVENWVKAPGGRPDISEFRRRAIDAGYVYRTVPREYGGGAQAPDPLKSLIVGEEFDRVRAPRELPHVGSNLVISTLLAAGADWQKERFIRRTIDGEYIWCQGFSEPGAGSDLASLRTKAELVGDEWVINGHKIWNSSGHIATHMLLLARTEPDAPKHQGITALLVRMKQPGVTVRPLRQITGQAGFNEIFLDDVRTPAHWMVGNRGEGWQVSRKTLVLERNIVGAAGRTEEIFDKLLRLARTVQIDGRPAIADPLIRDELGRIGGMVHAHKANAKRQFDNAVQGRADPPASGPLNKLYNSAILELIGRVAQKVMGADVLGGATEAPAGPQRWISQYMNSIAAQIGGGTSNIQRNIIAEHGLGMPRARELQTDATA